MPYTLLMCQPTFISSDIPNNIWMSNYSEEERKIDAEKAVSQWQNLYLNLVAAGATVYLLSPQKNLQDQVYTANVIAKMHHKDNTIILSNFKGLGRPGE